MNKHLLMLLVASQLALIACTEETTVVQQGTGGATDPTVFGFRNDPKEAYLKVDRMGGPATTTALLHPGSSGGARRQDFNLTEPVDDTQYAAEYIEALKTYHFELGPQLQQLGLAACGVPGADVESTNVDKCLDQAAARVIPDVLTFDTSQPSGYPNGRDLDDQVVDTLLALALLDLTDPSAKCGAGPCTIRTLADLPLNATESDPRPLAQFPFFNNVQRNPPPPAMP